MVTYRYYPRPQSGGVLAARIEPAVTHIDGLLVRTPAFDYVLPGGTVMRQPPSVASAIDNATSFLFVDIDGNIVVSDDSTTAHQPLARLTAASGEVTEILGEYCYQQSATGPTACLVVEGIGVPGLLTPGNMGGSAMVGVTGPVGVPGSPGAPGAPGSPGPTGAVGATGPAGIPGPDGHTGLPGPQGSPGLTGSVGPTGVTGQRGQTGTVGPTGPQGQQGVTGPGITGPAGPTGVPGATGPAAFSMQVYTCVFTGLGAVNQSHGQTNSAFVTIPSSVFQIPSLGGMNQVRAYGVLMATGPTPNVTPFNTAELRLTVGSQAGPGFPIRIGTGSFDCFSLAHMVMLPSGVATGSMQWRRAGGNMANYLAVGLIDVVSTTP